MAPEILRIAWESKRLTLAAGLLILTAPLFQPPAASADVQLCNGQWTNKPCEGTPAQVIPEADGSAPTVKDEARSKKRSLLHDFTMMRLSVEEKYKIQFNAADLETFCLSPVTTVEGCRAKIVEYQGQLDRRAADAAVIKTQEDSVALQREANRLQEERNRIEAEKPTVTIVERKRIFVVDNDLFDKRRDHRGHYNESGSSLSVQANGVAGGTQFNIGADVRDRRYDGRRVYPRKRHRGRVEALPEQPAPTYTR